MLTPRSDAAFPEIEIQRIPFTGGLHWDENGTLIRNPNIIATSPVTVVSQEEIRLRQVNVAEQILRELPGAVPSIGSQVNNGNGGAFKTGGLFARLIG